MDDERVVERLATSLGLKRDDVRYVARQKDGECYHALAVFLPADHGEASLQLADAINDAISIEAGLGNGAFLDLFAARRWRFAREARWYERRLAGLFPRRIDRKYAHLTRELAIAGRSATGEDVLAPDNRQAVVIVTSCRRDGRPVQEGHHNAHRTQAVMDCIEKHEQTLRAALMRPSGTEQADSLAVPVPVSKVTVPQAKQTSRPEAALAVGTHALRGVSLPGAAVEPIHLKISV